MQLNLLTHESRMDDAELITVPRVEYEALRQFYETMIGMRTSCTGRDVHDALAAHNVAEQALHQLGQDQARWRSRIEIITPKSE
ncbi:hypothetical protein [Metapseudomonas otitidis]|uniref:hypothetical protein n=1 Tax=Metapseudomonas otitidis TaxID=319939 RepID=UPI00281115B6|nr:hypothetical protein [Pseudomonas otitidis]WMR30574.1 hypothetical protein QT513_15245 [Pseudomonas otitidis]